MKTWKEFVQKVQVPHFIAIMMQIIEESKPIEDQSSELKKEVKKFRALGYQESSGLPASVAEALKDITNLQKVSIK